MKLTEHFTLESMLASPTAQRRGLAEQLTPDRKIVSALQLLCENILEPLRQHLGKPIHVSSGYRCVRLNHLIGGAENSQHTFGQAADITVEGITTIEIVSAIKLLSLPIDQCIEEFGQWVHVSYRPEPRGEYLQAKKINNKTIYK